MTSELLLEKLNAIDRKLSKLIDSSPKVLWCKVGAIKEATGWDAKKLERARLNGYVQWKRKDGGIWYDLNSIPEEMKLKHRQAQSTEHS